MGLIKYKSNYGDVAEYIKNEFEVKYSPHWCCIVYDGIFFTSIIIRLYGEYFYFLTIIS
jgi:hypothetical protein